MRLVFISITLLFVSACSTKKQATSSEIAPEMCICFAIVEKDIVMLKEMFTIRVKAHTL